MKNLEEHGGERTHRHFYLSISAVSQFSRRTYRNLIASLGKAADPSLSKAVHFEHKIVIIQFWNN